MKIQIFMCCHNSFEFIPPLCVPIQCGAAIDTLIDGAIYDNVGDNISEKNREYCELTAHYYAWKNVSADYYGFCHYRRFFCFNNKNIPYLVREKLSKNDVKLLGTPELIESLAREYDIIIPRSEDMGLSVWEHYSSAKYHYITDLELFIRLLKKKCPDISTTADRYLEQNKQFFCNMFILKKDLFFEYCETLFDILSDFDALKKRHGNFQADRTDGYLGEVFTGIFVNYKLGLEVPVKEICRMDVKCSLSKRALYKFLPPETKRRFLAKKICKAIEKR